MCFFLGESFYAIPSVVSRYQTVLQYIFFIQVFPKPHHRLTDHDEIWHAYLFFLRENLFAIPFVLSFRQIALQYLIVYMYVIHIKYELCSP